MISMLSLFECIIYVSSVSSEDIKLIVIIHWIFHVSDLFRLSMISFKYGLILSRYSLSDNVLLLLPLLSNCSKRTLIISLEKASESITFTVVSSDFEWYLVISGNS